MQWENATRTIRAAVAVVLWATASLASADAYRITTHAAGHAGHFNLDGMFVLPGPVGTGPYELDIVTEFDNPSVYQEPERTNILAFDISLRIELTVGGNRYTVSKEDAWLELDYFPDLDGGPLNDLRYSVHFFPYASGNFGEFQQRMLLAPDLLAFSDLLQPALLATPDVEWAQFNAGTYIINEVIIQQLGDASGLAPQFSYQIMTIPEPATYAMTLLGCAVVAGAARLRRPKA
ncbi:PEP-CTERM sorting domain-containing protein [Massilia dura]|uniref:PEP-CTERM sorting domain-containing protein n=1 Tax=Pseudoduganella dura TaxID=321982 RepID=A0A6I3XKS1_9BURK|nr:PEP-CTERM sorting domain-containing protein [Pseudoduganella dura]MUI15170.1 PEP-CTERM sorting domain-containing protein [Pseudoduganella dura]GGY16671.1 hypothetical protein GCM10007386_53140 [Pseudoduganella dura]